MEVYFRELIVRFMVSFKVWPSRSDSKICSRMRYLVQHIERHYARDFGTAPIDAQAKTSSRAPMRTRPSQASLLMWHTHRPIVVQSLIALPY
jgi:hypothetical protein